MSAKKKPSEGIALLSMYNDEDMDVDEEEDEDEEEDDLQENDMEADVEERYDDLRNPENFASDFARENTPPFLPSQPSIPDDEQTLEESPAPPTPQKPQISISAPPLLMQTPPQNPPLSDSFDIQRRRKESLAIVDYAHDETAMSPEAEEGEILSSGRVMFGVDLQVSDGNFPEKTPPGTVQILTPSIQATPPQSSEQLEQSKYEINTAINYSSNEHATAPIDVDITVSVEIEKDADPLEKFLPPPPATMCSLELQEKINKFLAYKRAGKSFNADLRNRKDYRNPDFLLHAVSYQDIDQIGTCFSRDVFDPHGYDKSDYYDEIEADMKREMERKEQERKKSQKVEFVQSHTQPGAVAPAPKISTQIPGANSSIHVLE
ncbi:transcriptional regulator family protein isoform X2 [Tasmannia lanceolata]|uniref:transcriptional regulator family protein isoform X2 n=1 Tax=Tasmannia lanceolata TaxID=3420 RepID=UPI004063240C